MRRQTFAALLLGAVACTDSSAPSGRQASFGISPALDTVAAGVSVTFIAERADSTVDEWSSSDSRLARIDSQQVVQPGRARVTTLAAGTVVITARRLGDSGQATLVILPPPPPPPQDTAPPIGAFRIRPALDTVIVGDLVKFVVERSDSTVDQWRVSDTSRVRVLAHERGWARVRIRAAGTVTISASRGADSAHATLVILPPEPAPDPVTFGDWEAISLGLLGAAAGRATAIDDSGTIVGELSVPATINSLRYGFIYRDGVMQKLWSSDDVYTVYMPIGVSPSGRVAGSSSGGQLMVWDGADAVPRFLGDGSLYRFVGFNAQGDMLVDYGDRLDSGSGVLRAVVWRNNVREELGSLNDSVAHSRETAATAWNANGQIVGGSKVASFSNGDGDWTEVFHPFIWENGVMRDLGVLGPRPCVLATGNECSEGWAMDINAHGIVVGMSNDGPLTRAFIWENGVLQELGGFPGRSTRALAINDRGQIVGTLGSEWNPRDTIVFWQNEQVQIVTTNAVGQPMLGSNGEVVGMMVVDGDIEPHGFIWQAGILTDLGRSEVAAINKRGEIVGARGNMPTLWRRKS